LDGDSEIPVIQARCQRLEFPVSQPSQILNREQSGLNLFGNFRVSMMDMSQKRTKLPGHIDVLEQFDGHIRVGASFIPPEPAIDGSNQLTLLNTEVGFYRFPILCGNCVYAFGLGRMREVWENRSCVARGSLQQKEGDYVSNPEGIGFSKTVLLRRFSIADQNIQFLGQNLLSEGHVSSIERFNVFQCSE